MDVLAYQEITSSFPGTTELMHLKLQPSIRRATRRTGYCDNRRVNSGGLARAGGVFEDDALIDRVNRALRRMWSRLESLPRSDAFWSRTNHRTTWYKVENFAHRCVDRNPSDETARWALVGLSMHAGSFGGLQLLADEAATRDEAVYDRRYVPASRAASSRIPRLA
ncbi:hypothetical protein KZZ52_13695 [Dactylosporangium sp. AC04546]|uniref:hypothetical protein n=1 Tax=Dactylosporangium sp. AC04546 TaxID=2862460 RepID=UPI001EDD562D|nr:hypothetical protein [Dactylosporangium sp. AC04546]WVK86381.1 hypothetical protein KZZ52_13695 [Dactylosporangium sp. AC04546]